MLKLDIGCGTRKTNSLDEHPFIGVDIIPFDGVDVVHDVRVTPWPWEDGSVDEVFSSHFLEHLTGEERISFFNELHRVMKVGGKALIITPDWSHSCSYGDPTHKWPPLSAWYPLYLNKAWRAVNAPHVDGAFETKNELATGVSYHSISTGYTCDFDWVIGYGMDERLLARSDDHRNHAIQFYTNSARDLHVTLVKRPPDAAQKS